MFSSLRARKRRPVGQFCASILAGSLLLSTNVLPVLAFAKHPSFQMPSLGKLTVEEPTLDNSTSFPAGSSAQAPAGGANTGNPQANNGKDSKEAAEASRSPSDKQANSQASNTSLAPVTLNQGQSNQAAPANSAGSATLLKSTVTQTNFVSKPASETEEANAKSLVKENQDPVNQAKQINAMPLPLMESADEANKKTDLQHEAEKVQISELWESTLSRSPDIQFVLQKLMPTSDPSHTSSIMMHMLSTAMFGAMGAANMMVPNAGMYMMSSTGASLISNVVGMQDSKIAKKAKITQEEAIMLYKMVRDTADRLVDSYRNYKKNFNALTSASTDLIDLQNLASDAKKIDAAKSVEMEYTLRKAQRDVDALGEDARHYRQNLIDLAGPDAIVKLDKELDSERSQIDGGTSMATPVNFEPSASPASTKEGNLNKDGSYNPETVVKTADNTQKDDKAPAASKPADESAPMEKTAQNTPAVQSNPVAQTAQNTPSKEPAAKDTPEQTAQAQDKLGPQM